LQKEEPMISNDDLHRIAVTKFVVNDPQGVEPYPYQTNLPLEFTNKEDKLFPTQWAYVLEGANLSGTIGVCHWGNQLVLDVAYYGRFDLWERNKIYYDKIIVES